MKVLEPRTYSANTRDERRLLPFGVAHPAKMHPLLARDLFLRYTLPGQTVFDPFGGRGTSLVGITLGRDVLLNELEAPFVAYQRQNLAHLREHTLPGVVLGRAEIHQGDSRRLDWLPTAPTADDAPVVDGCVTSPPFGGSEAVDNGKVRGVNGQHGGGNAARDAYQEAGNIATLAHHRRVAAVVSSPPYADALQGDSEAQRKRKAERYARGEFKAVRPDVYTSATNKGSEGFFGGYSPDPANIGNLPHVAAVVSSPPYGDVASRDRSDEPYCQGQDPALRAKYGTGDTNRHIDGYGHAAGQIGDLPHHAPEARGVAACLTSPPYEATLPVNGHDAAYFERIGGIRHTAADYGRSDGQIGAEQGETYAGAMLQVLAECYRVVRDGGVLVLVTGNYVRSGAIVDLAADTIALAQAAGWTPWERWEHRKATISFWRRLHHRQGRPIVAHEDVLVFVKGARPAWDFADLPPTYRAPARLDDPAASVANAEAIGVLALPLDPAGADGAAGDVADAAAGE